MVRAFPVSIASASILVWILRPELRSGGAQPVRVGVGLTNKPIGRGLPGDLPAADLEDVGGGE